MIKKLKLGFLITVLSLLVGVSSAYAVNITYSNYTDILLPTTGYTMTVYPASGATSVVVNNSSIDVVVPTSSTFVIASHNNIAVSASGGTDASSNSCTGTTNTLTITGNSAITYTLTPGAGVCAASSSGGPSGGGGSYTPPADTTPPSATSVSINAGVAAASSLSATLTLAATDATQMLISNDAGFAGASWETYATSKAWTLTSGDGVKTVYAKFRDAALNMSVAVSDTITVSGTGTIAVVSNEPTDGCSGNNQYNTSTGALCINNVGATAHGLYNFGTTTLKNGSKGEAVKELQRFLNAKLNLGLVIDGALGPKTIAVIKQWQLDNGLVADGLIGPATKAMMNASVQ
ncbi:MAG: peptidoglycan-binding domain-containing protein [Candidatus Paceibacterota bacterium]|jgi:hypothetical protein